VPRDRATTPPPPSHLDAWLSAFVEELQRIRPHVSFKLATVLGRAEYQLGLDPKKAAAAYHARQAPTLPPKPASKRRRST
jgi:hypothetical protein